MAHRQRSRRGAIENTVSGLLVGMDFHKRNVPPYAPRRQGHHRRLRQRCRAATTRSPARLDQPQRRSPLRQQPQAGISAARPRLRHVRRGAKSSSRNSHSATSCTAPRRHCVSMCPTTPKTAFTTSTGISMWCFQPTPVLICCGKLHEVLTMLWVDYAQEKPERLSPKARDLRTALLQRFQAA